MGRDYSVIYGNVGDDIQDSSTAMQSLIKRYINRRYMDIVRRADLDYINEDYTVSVTSGTRDYSLNSDFIEALYAVDTTNDTLLKRVNFEDIVQEKSDDLDITGTVTSYIIFDSDDGNKYIRFWRTPNSNITVAMPYRARPSELSSDTDEPILGLEDIIEIGATADALRYKRQYGKATQLEKNYEVMLSNWIWERESQRDLSFQFKPRVFDRDNLV